MADCLPLGTSFLALSPPRIVNQTAYNRFSLPFPVVTEYVLIFRLFLRFDHGRAGEKNKLQPVAWSAEGVMEM